MKIAEACINITGYYKICLSLKFRLSVEILLYLKLPMLSQLEKGSNYKDAIDGIKLLKRLLTLN